MPIHTTGVYMVKGGCTEVCDIPAGADMYKHIKNNGTDGYVQFAKSSEDAEKQGYQAIPKGMKHIVIEGGKIKSWVI